MLTPEVEERVKRMERELAEIDAGIQALMSRQAEVLASDEEYANYVEAYQSYYDGEPLEIREYYEKMDELRGISLEFEKPSADYEAVYRKFEHRLLYLERILAA